MNCNLSFKEVPIVTRYFAEASSINFRRSVVYGCGILGVLLRYALNSVHIWPWKQLVRKEMLRPVKS